MSSIPDCCKEPCIAALQCWLLPKKARHSSNGRLQQCMNRVSCAEHAGCRCRGCCSAGYPVDFDLFGTMQITNAATYNMKLWNKQNPGSVKNVVTSVQRAFLQGLGFL